MAVPRRPHTSTGILVVLGFFACKQDAPKPIRQDAAAVFVADAVVAPTDADTSAGKITISVAKPRTPGAGFAKRCAVAGPPLATTCTGGSAGIAIDAKGILYLANGELVHRFAIGDECKLEPSGEPVVMPLDNPRPQTVGKGPIYMRSGGVAWNVLRAGDAVYAHDFLVGLFRIDRDKVEPVCTQEFGFHTFVKSGKRLLGQRKGIEEVTPGKAGACRTKSAGIDDKARALFAAQGRIYTKLDDLGVRLCHVAAMTECGDGACILDHNCPQIVQLNSDGTVLRTIDDDRLFDVRPWSVDGLASATDGSVYIYARHRDKVGDKDVCEAAVYKIPPAVFAR